mmetsp:Transcript_21485/g.51614  ORF Transcript_21485/g.51614 Transcript_21485/m.51614 type:complete len:246 (+) Transcript_21485:652-1389(+)
MHLPQQLRRRVVVGPPLVSVLDQLIDPHRPCAALRPLRLRRLQHVERVGAALRRLLRVIERLDAKLHRLLILGLRHLLGALRHDVLRVLRVGVYLDEVRVAPAVGAPRVVLAVTHHSERPDLRRQVLADRLLLRVEPHALADVVVAPGAPHVERHLEADGEDALVELLCALAKRVRHPRRRAHVVLAVMVRRARLLPRVPVGRVVEVVCAGGGKRRHDVGASARVRGQRWRGEVVGRWRGERWSG